MEFLKTVISEETYNALAKELEGKDIKLADLKSGEYVSKSKYDAALKDVDTYKTQVTERDADLEKLKTSATLSDEQKKEFETLQTKYETDKTEWEKKLNDNARDAALEISIARANVIDPVALKAHVIGKASELELKDGVLVGLDEHITELKADKLSYLVPTDAKALGGNLGNPPKPEQTKEAQILAQINAKQ